MRSLTIRRYLFPILYTGIVSPNSVVPDCLRVELKSFYSNRRRFFSDFCPFAFLEDQNFQNLTVGWSLRRSPGRRRPLLTTRRRGFVRRRGGVAPDPGPRATTPVACATRSGLRRHFALGKKVREPIHFRVLRAVTRTREFTRPATTLARGERARTADTYVSRLPRRASGVAWVQKPSEGQFAGIPFQKSLKPRFALGV